MGNDGGSFAHRTEVVKMKKREKKLETFQEAKMKADLCCISKEPLKAPLCICRLGNIYNKEELLKRLIDGNMKGFEHIKKMRDVKELRIPER